MEVSYVCAKIDSHAIQLHPSRLDWKYLILKGKEVDSLSLLPNLCVLWQKQREQVDSPLASNSNPLQRKISLKRAGWG